MSAFIPLATLEGINAHASVPLIGSLMLVGRLRIACRAPSFDPMRTTVGLSVCSAMKVSINWRSAGLARGYQIGRLGARTTAGVEFSTEPSFEMSPTPKRALRCQSMTLLACVEPATPSVVCKALLLAFEVSKSKRVVPFTSAVYMLRSESDMLLRASAKSQ